MVAEFGLNLWNRSRSCAWKSVCRTRARLWKSQNCEGPFARGEDRGDLDLTVSLLQLGVYLSFQRTGFSCGTTSDEARQPASRLALAPGRPHLGNATGDVWGDTPLAVSPRWQGPLQLRFHLTRSLARKRYSRRTQRSRYVLSSPHPSSSSPPATAHHHTLLPPQLTSLLLHYHITSFFLTLSSGRWASSWPHLPTAAAPIPSSPASGIELTAWLELLEGENEEEEEKRWEGFKGALGGLFCAGIGGGAGRGESRPLWGYPFEGAGEESGASSFCYGRRAELMSSRASTVQDAAASPLGDMHGEPHAVPCSPSLRFACGTEQLAEPTQALRWRLDAARGAFRARGGRGSGQARGGECRRSGTVGETERGNGEARYVYRAARQRGELTMKRRFLNDGAVRS